MKEEEKRLFAILNRLVTQAESRLQERESHNDLYRRQETTGTGFYLHEFADDLRKADALWFAYICSVEKVIE